jgi:hypothetical protein
LGEALPTPYGTMTFSWELDRLSLHFSQKYPANPKLQGGFG